VKTCPCCFGEGRLDMRDDDALIGEMWEPELIEFAKSQGMRHPVGVVDCEECDATGWVSDGRAADLAAAARAAVDQALARVRDEHPELWS
jgi:hypothetical protein